MTSYKDYTRYRDVARKRLIRMEKAGMPYNMALPTVKELKGMSEAEQERAFDRLVSFIESGPSQSKRREALKVAKRSERRGYPKKYQGYIKGLEKLDQKIDIQDLPGFFAYMDYRFSQGAVAKQYLFDEFVEDYKTLIRKGYKAETIIRDYQKFVGDQMKLQHRKQSMKGWSAKKSFNYWKKFAKKG